MFKVIMVLVCPQYTGKPMRKKKYQTVKGSLLKIRSNEFNQYFSVIAKLM